MQPFKARRTSHSHNPFTFLNTFRLDFLSKLATNAKKAELLCCFALLHFPFSVFFSSTPSGRSQVGVVRRANPLRYLSATICTGSTWVRTELDCIRWHNRPFSAIQQFPLAQRHSRVRKRVTQDPKRLQQTLQEMQQQQQQQSVDCNRYLSCFSGELSLLFLASKSDMVGVPL